MLSATSLRPEAATGVTLSDARFNGLTRVVVTTNVQLTGIAAAQIVITKPDGTVVPTAKITAVDASTRTLSVGIDADQFAHISSQGTTIATKAFGSFKASRTVKVQKLGEPSVNGHIMGSSQWTDEGWSTSKTDPAFYDPASSQVGLYRFADLTPNKDDKEKPVDWKDGNIVTPAHRDKNMLVLFVEFPDRRAADAGEPYRTFPAYLDFLQGAVDWYGVLRPVPAYARFSTEHKPSGMDHDEQECQPILMEWPNPHDVRLCEGGLPARLRQLEHQGR